MPDEYLNLTPREAEELLVIANQRPIVAQQPPRQSRRRRPEPDSFDELQPLITLLFLAVLILIPILAYTSPKSPTPTPASRGELPIAPIQQNGSEIGQATRDQLTSRRQAKSNQVSAASPSQAEDSFLAGWDYATADFPITLYTNREVSGRVPANVGFLRSFHTSNGWAFVTTLDGATWGWAQLPQLTMRHVFMQSQFGPALARLRDLDVPPPSQKGAYLPDGWAYIRTTSPWTLHCNGNEDVMPAGTEFLLHLRPEPNGRWFVITLDGKTWGGVNILKLPEPWPIRNGPKFKAALSMLHAFRTFASEGLD